MSPKNKLLFGVLYRNEGVRRYHTAFGQALEKVSDV
jgi:hypothetical protein